jgi:aldose 1-epimerase
LVVDGHELLVSRVESPFHWGSYPMAPWANRVRDGRFTFDGVAYELFRNFGDHAIHGTVFDRPWGAEGDGWFRIDLGPAWPFPGHVRQRFALDEDQLHMRIEVHAAELPMPASCGWHPWFRRRLGTGGAVELSFDAEWMEQRDGEIPTGVRMRPSAGPWDDCFGGVRWPATVTWPGALSLEITSDCDYMVVFDQYPTGVCAEPQTGPPNALNTGAAVVHPGRPLVAEATWRWTA